MVWNSGWDKLFAEKEWGKYPPEELIRFIKRSFADQNTKDIKVLEVGCGTGANIWFLSREGFQVFGIDGSEVAIEQAKKRMKEEGLNADLAVGDILNLPYADNFFDCVLDIECIYANSYKDSELIMQEIKRVLVPDGLFFSKTFMSGTYGDGNGEKLQGEANTYLNIEKGGFNQGYGIIRLTSEEEISKLYGVFQVKNVDYIIRSDNNRAHEIKEWLIVCQK